MKKFLSVLLAVCMVLSFSVTAFASNTAERSDGYNSRVQYGEAIVETTKNASGVIDVVIVNADSNSDKNEFLSSEESYLKSISNTKKKENDAKSTTVNLYDYQRKDVKSSYVYSKLDSDVSYGVFSDLRVDGTSKVYWAGSNPFNCDKIKMEDAFYIAGVAVGFTFSSGGKWSVSTNLTSSTATWSESYDNKYTITHDYSNVDFNGYELYIKQTTTGYYTFSTTTYQLSAVDSTLL